MGHITGLDKIVTMHSSDLFWNWVYGLVINYAKCANEYNYIPSIKKCIVHWITLIYYISLLAFTLKKIQAACILLNVISTPEDSSELRFFQIYMKLHEFKYIFKLLSCFTLSNRLLFWTVMD